jgi:hypothetical protein
MTKPSLRWITVPTIVSLAAAPACGSPQTTPPAQPAGPAQDGGPFDARAEVQPPDAATDTDVDGDADPYLALDPSPFGMHPALVHDAPGDPYEPARQAGLAWARGANAPYLVLAIVDHEKTGDPAQMTFKTKIPHPDLGLVDLDYDKEIHDIVAAGLNAMWNIDVEHPDGTGVTIGFRKPGSWLPEDETAYRAFVETAVRRYPEVRVWQVSNEPNIGGDRKLADFARLQKMTYEAIKKADPRTVVAMGGVGGNLADDVMKNDTYFDAVLDELGGCCVDVFDIHFYGDPRGGAMKLSDGTRLLGYRDFEATATFYRSRLDSRGYQRTRIWTTENGTPSGTWRADPNDPKAALVTSEADQARDLPKRWLVALAAGVEKMFWAFGMSERYGAWDDDFFDHTGLIYDGHGAPGGTKKLAYWALWQATRRMKGCDVHKVGRLPTSIPETRAYRCEKTGGGSVVLAWWDTFLVPGFKQGDTVSVEIPWDALTAVARSALPNAAAGSQVSDPTTAFPMSTLAPASGRVSVTLGADPTWVEKD